MENMECAQDSFDDICSGDEDYTLDKDKSSPQTFSQDQINDLNRDLSLYKEKSGF